MTVPTVVTNRDDFRVTATVVLSDARAPAEVRVAVLDPFDTYRRARWDAGGLLHETTGGQSGWGVFGVDPAERLTADVPVDDDWGDPGADTTPSLVVLEPFVDSEILVHGDCDASYPCGLFGWLLYDAARELEPLPEQITDDRGLPHLQLDLYDLVAPWAEPWPDDGETMLRVTCCPVVEADEDLDAAYDEARMWATDFATEAVEDELEPVSAPAESDEVTFESARGCEVFADRIHTAKWYVHDGGMFQANPSQRLAALAAVHPMDVYAVLRGVNSVPYLGLLEPPGADLVSASPELLLHVEGSRLVAEPIADICPRGATTEGDEVLEADLAADERECAEHVILVDLERNDLGKVSEYGLVGVTEYRRVNCYSEVMHLVSLVEGTRREGISLADTVAAVFPDGTITGVPKPRTMEITDELEATRRGPHTGSMFAAGFDDRMVLNIIIRTFARFGDEYHLRVGAGIAHDSDPQHEYDETLVKARALTTAIDETLGERVNMTVGTER